MIVAKGFTVEKLGLSDVREVKLIIDEFNLGNWTEIDLEKEIQRPDNLTLIVKKDNKLIGFIITRLIIIKNLHIDSSECKIGNKSPNASSAEIEIYNIAVIKPYQRRQIGKVLIKELLNQVKDFTKVILWLEVRKSNLAAINFYKSNHFSFHYIRKNFYNNPVEDALVMNLIIEN